MNEAFRAPVEAVSRTNVASREFKSEKPIRNRSFGRRARRLLRYGFLGLSLATGFGCSKGLEQSSLSETAVFEPSFLTGNSLEDLMLRRAFKFESIADVISVTPDFEESEKVEFILGQDQIPNIALFRDGSSLQLDRNKVLTSLETAKRSGMPQVIDGQVASIPTWKEKEAQGIPRFSLPDDVVSEQDLSEKGIKIIQPDNTHLYIRESAFMQGGPLETFNIGKRNLTIVLVDGPTPTEQFMKDARYDSVRQWVHLDSVVSKKYRQNYILKTEADLEMYENLFKKYTKDQKEREINYLLGSMAENYFWENKLTEVEVSDIARMRHDFFTFGGYHIGPVISSSLSETGFNMHGESLIFIATTGREPKRLIGRIVFALPNGQVKALVKELGDIGGGLMDLTPDPEQNLLTPEQINENAALMEGIRRWHGEPTTKNSYKFGFDTSAWSLRHELKHDAFIGGRLFLGQAPDSSEWDTDIAVEKDVVQAYKFKEETGNDALYSFLLSVPPEYGGGFIAF